MTRTDMSVFIVVSEEAEEEKTQTLAMSIMILIRVFVWHVKESVHERIGHEIEVKVLEHLNELILTPALLEIVVGDLTASSELAFLFDQLFAKCSSLETSLLQLISSLIYRFKEWVVDLWFMPYWLLFFHLFGTLYHCNFVMVFFIFIIFII